MATVGFAVVKLEGLLTKNAVVRYDGNGRACAHLNVKVYRANGFERTVMFVEVESRGEDADELARGLKQGDVVRVEGSLVSRRWSCRGQGGTKLVVDAAAVEIVERAA